MPSVSQPPSSVALRLEDSVFAVKKRVAGPLPRVGLVLGSGLGGFGDTLAGLAKVAYSDVPHMSTAGVPGHSGHFCFGRVAGVPVVCMQGRVHLYEGHPIDRVVQGVRVMARLGVRCVLVTNAAGGLAATWSRGDLMAITDHINLTGVSPLAGVDDDTIGPRFPDMTAAYDAQVRAALHDAAREAGVALREGVYAGVLGPQYETPAEIRMLRSLGADAVGMSTVCEVIALRHMGVRVGGLSCITNLAAGVGAGTLDHAEVEATARARQGELTALLTGWIARTGQDAT